MPAAAAPAPRGSRPGWPGSPSCGRCRSSSRVSRLIAVDPPTSTSVDDRVEVLAQGPHRVARGLRVGRPVERGEHDDLAVDDLRLRSGRPARAAGRPAAASLPTLPGGRLGLGDARVGRDELDHGRHCSTGTTICTGEALSASKCASSTSWASTDSTSAKNSSVCGTWSSSSCVISGRARGQRQEGHQPHHARPRPDQPRQPTPEAAGVAVLRAVRRTERPVGPAAEQHQRRRQQRQRAEHGGGDPDAHRPGRVRSARRGPRAAGTAVRGSRSRPEASDRLEGAAGRRSASRRTSTRGRAAPRGTARRSGGSSRSRPRSRG